MLIRIGQKSIECDVLILIDKNQTVLMVWMEKQIHLENWGQNP